MVIVTVGIIVQAVDALTIRIHSEIFGNISRFIGNILVFVGYVILLWGLFAVKADFNELSIPGKCLVAISCLLIACLIALRILAFIERSAQHLTCF